MHSGKAAVERVLREESGRLAAAPVRRFGDTDIAEEAAGETPVPRCSGGRRPA
ncbi:MAG TPA: hypothetical protein VJT31_12365 [Rugosimonospora sp.]|nr:hypothetical protein [Rugosimonospora sp.]